MACKQEEAMITIEKQLMCDGFKIEKNDEVYIVEKNTENGDD